MQCHKTEILPKLRLFLIVEYSSGRPMMWRCGLFIEFNLTLIVQPRAAFWIEKMQV